MKNASPKHVFCMDWGILDSLRLLNRGILPLANGDEQVSKPEMTPRDREIVIDMISDPANIFIAHAKQYEFFPGWSAKLVQFALAAGYRRRRGVDFGLLRPPSLRSLPVCGAGNRACRRLLAGVCPGLLTLAVGGKQGLTSASDYSDLAGADSGTGQNRRSRTEGQYNGLREDRGSAMSIDQSREKPFESWKDIREKLDSFPAPRVGFDSEGEMFRLLWVFRGHKRADYDLEPTIERAAEGKTASWSVLESTAVWESQSKARLFLDPATLPGKEETLSWLALMQHYGIPTRLLDFTYSPYVGLYFGLRSRSKEEEGHPISLWAIDAQALQRQAGAVSCAADQKARVRPGWRRRGVRPEDQRTALGALREDNEAREKMVNDALAPPRLASKMSMATSFTSTGSISTSTGLLFSGCPQSRMSACRANKVYSFSTAPKTSLSKTHYSR